MRDFDQKVDDNVRVIEEDGHTFQVIREDPFGFYRISYKGGLPLTAIMNGQFTSLERAVQAIELWAKNTRKAQEADRVAVKEIEDQKVQLQEKEVEIADHLAAMETMKPKVDKNGKRTSLERNRS